LRRIFHAFILALQTPWKVPVALFTAEADDALMEQSIRNEIPGVVKEIVSDKVLSEIIVETAVGDVEFMANQDHWIRESLKGSRAAIWPAVMGTSPKFTRSTFEIVTLLIFCPLYDN
jgi:hypothetical protein